jgi:hypothetical protein
MITYRKNSLKTKVLGHGDHHQNNSGGYFTRGIALSIKEFIEKGEYSRIVDIKIIGENKTLIAMIIYQIRKEAKSQ